MAKLHYTWTFLQLLDYMELCELWNVYWITAIASAVPGIHYSYIPTKLSFIKDEVCIKCWFYGLWNILCGSLFRLLDFLFPKIGNILNTEAVYVYLFQKERTRENAGAGRYTRKEVDEMQVSLKARQNQARLTTLRRCWVVLQFFGEILLGSK